MLKRQRQKTRRFLVFGAVICYANSFCFIKVCAAIQESAYLLLYEIAQLIQLQHVLPNLTLF
jgi:hypothetical protein